MTTFEEQAARLNDAQTELAEIEASLRRIDALILDAIQKERAESFKDSDWAVTDAINDIRRIRFDLNNFKVDDYAPLRRILEASGGEVYVPSEDDEGSGGSGSGSGSGTGDNPGGNEGGSGEARACGNPLLWYNRNVAKRWRKKARACGNPLLWYNDKRRR